MSTTDERNLFLGAFGLAFQRFATGGMKIKLVDAIVNIKDPANLHIMDNRDLSATVKLGMFTLTKNARWACDRMLRAGAFPLAQIKFPCSRNGFKAEPGDVFRIRYAPDNIDSIFRIGNITENSPTSEDIEITAFEDIAYVGIPLLPDTSSNYYEVIDIDTALITLSIIYITELPYNMSPDTIVLLALVSRMNGNESGYQIYTSVSGDNNSFTPFDVASTFDSFGQLTTAYPKTGYVDDEIGFDMDVVPYGYEDIITISREAMYGNTNLAVLIGPGSDAYTFIEELISFQTITPLTETSYRIENVVRGRYDTSIRAWPIGTKFFFIGNTDHTTMISSEFLVGVTKIFKMIEFNSADEGDISEAVPCPYTITGRVYKPLTPANLMVNDSCLEATYTEGDDLVITWSPRNRITGAGTSDAYNVPPTATIEGLFEVRIFEYYNPYGYYNTTPKRTFTALAEATVTYTAAMMMTDYSFVYPLQLAVVLRSYLTGTDGNVYYSDVNYILVRKDNGDDPPV